MRFNWSYPLPHHRRHICIANSPNRFEKNPQRAREYNLQRGGDVAVFLMPLNPVVPIPTILLQLGTRLHCRDKLFFLGHKIVGYCIMLQLLHLDTETLTFFIFVSGHRSFITLLRCDCREAKQLSRAQLCLWPILSQKELHITATAKC